MNKSVVLVAGALALSAAGGAIAVSESSVATSDPGANNAANVIGESYARAISILKAQGMRATFGGSVGSDVPQAQCIVDQQKMGGNGRMILMLNCTTKAVQDAQPDTTPSGGGGAGVGGPPKVGSNGVTTVHATPVGPQPGMNIPGM